MPATERPIVVTGAGGFLGGRVAVALGPRARTIVRRPVPWLEQDRQSPADLGIADGALGASLAGADAVIHLAGINEVVARNDPERAFDETVAIAANVADAAVAAGVGRVVYVSTVHVYGDHLQPGAHITEDLDPHPTSVYARARLACEDVLRAAAGLDVVVLRLTNAVGAPASPSVDRWTLVASDLCRHAVLDGTMTLHSSGAQVRDFITLGDATRLVVAATEPTVPGGIYNLASGTSIAVRRLAELVGERVEAATGSRPRLDAPPLTTGPDTPYLVSTDRLAAHGLVAEQRLVDGVDEIVRHCIEHQSTLREARVNP